MQAIREHASYTTVSWDYPPSPAAYYESLLSRGASHSRLLRIAYLSRSNASATSSPCPRATPASYFLSTPPLTCQDGPHRRLLSRSCVHARPRSAHPTSHTLKRRMPQWPKPPHYHASLLRSPLSRRKGLFRTVLPPDKAVDFFRWDVLVGAGFSLSASCRAREWTGSRDGDACASLQTVESVLEPYEAAAGFFGWHGLGLGVTRRVDEDVDDGCCWSLEQDGEYGPSRVQPEMDEAAVEEGRASWTRMAEELVGPPGLVLRSVVEDGKSGKVTLHSDPTYKDAVDVHSLSMSSRREELRWDPNMGPSPSRAASALDEKRRCPPSSSAACVPGSSSDSKLEIKTDSPSTWWYGPSPLRGPPPAPHLPSFRFVPPPSVPYGPPPLQFSPWFPGGRVASMQGHGYWYGAQPIGTPSPMPRDPNLAKSIPPHSHVFTSPLTSTSPLPAQSPRYPAEPSLGRDDCDKETETDHGYESTTTTTDSDPPPHTPIGAATTSHCVDALQLHGDDEVEVHGVEIDREHAAASMTIRLPDPSAPVKLPDRFSMSPSPSVSSDSPGSDRDGCESSKATVVFPSLNGSFCQESSSQVSVYLSSPGVSAQTTPAGTLTPGSSSSLSPSKEPSTRLSLGDEEDPKAKRRTEGACSPSSDSLAYTPNLCSPPPTSPSRGLRKDSQGFWEPVTPISPSSSASSLSLSPLEGKMRSRSTARQSSSDTGAAESPGSASSASMLSAKARSLSPSPSHAASAGSTRSSSSRPTSFSSPISTSASASVFGGSYSSSPSPPSGSSFLSPNSTTLLPAFLATATVKRKKASRTREIVDRLRSSSMDAGKGGVGLGWLASPTGGEQDGKLGKTSSGSDQTVGNHAAGQPSPPPASRSGADSASCMGSEKVGQALGEKSRDTGSGGKRSGTSQAALASLDSHASSKTVATTANPGITPFPILSVSQTPASSFTMARQSQAASTIEREPATAKPFHGVDGSKMNVNVATSPSSRGPQFVPSTPHGGTSPSARPPHHPLPSPTHPTVHPPPALGPPPPMLTVSPYPHPMYMPFTQYHLAAPPHQGRPGQGTWMTVYPGRPVHPLPAQAHVAPITGVSGMRHVSW